MATGIVKIDASIAGTTPTIRQYTVTEEGSIALTPTLVAGDAGTINAGGDGVDTLATGHGILDTDTVTIAWATGKRYGCTVETSTTNAITVAAGAGDALPAEDTAVIVGVEQELIFPLDGDEVVILLVDCQQRSVAHFRKAADVSMFALELQTNAPPFLWFTDCGYANPLTGDACLTVVVANCTTTAALMTLVAIFDPAAA
jgi:hypothetical protein